jgi:hypothetical protein
VDREQEWKKRAGIMSGRARGFPQYIELQIYYDESSIIDVLFPLGMSLKNSPLLCLNPIKTPSRVVEQDLQSPSQLEARAGF